MITLNGLFSPIKMSRNLFLLESTWSAPSHLRPLTLFFIPYLQSKPQHVEKYLTLYADFYRNQQPRPLNVYLQMPTPGDFAIAYQTASKARKHIGNFSNHMDPVDKILVHGMSIGCFLQAATLDFDKKDIFRNPFAPRVKERIVGQLYDSPVYGGPARFGLDRMVRGLTKDIRNPLLRQVLQTSVKGYLSMATTRMMIFDNFIDTFINDTPIVPTLVLTSEADQLCDVPLFEQIVINEWMSRARDRDVKVTYKCFPGDSHARLLQLYPEEYKRVFFEYLNQVQPLLEVFDGLNELRDGEEEEEESYNKCLSSSPEKKRSN